jgi:hypothetical protein
MFVIQNIHSFNNEFKSWVKKYPTIPICYVYFENNLEYPNVHYVGYTSQTGLKKHTYLKNHWKMGKIKQNFDKNLSICIYLKCNEIDLIKILKPTINTKIGTGICRKLIHNSTINNNLDYSNKIGIIFCGNDKYDDKYNGEYDDEYNSEYNFKQKISIHLSKYSVYEDIYDIDTYNLKKSQYKLNPVKVKEAQTYLLLPKFLSIIRYCKKTNIEQTKKIIINIYNVYNEYIKTHKSPLINSLFCQKIVDELHKRHFLLNIDNNDKNLWYYYKNIDKERIKLCFFYCHPTFKETYYSTGGCMIYDSYILNWKQNGVCSKLCQLNIQIPNI